MAKKKTAKKSKRSAKRPARPDVNQAAKSMVDLIAGRTESVDGRVGRPSK